MSDVAAIERARVIVLGREDLPRALPLSQALNWPYRLEDWETALALGEGIGVEIDGELRATGMWWPWGEEFATVGTIIVSAELQGRGLGALVMRELLQRSGARSVVLRSTKEGRKLYERLGFVPFGLVHQHQASGTTAAARMAAVAPPLGAAVRPLRAADVPAIERLDRAASGMERDRLMEFLRAVGDLVVLERAGAIAGYACARRWGRGVVIGPVVAADADDARALIARFATAHGDVFLRIDVTDASGLSAWLEDMGLPRVDGVVSMARGAPPHAAPGRMLCALATQSLG